MVTTVKQYDRENQRTMYTNTIRIKRRLSKADDKIMITMRMTTMSTSYIYYKQTQEGYGLKIEEIRFA